MGIECLYFFREEWQRLVSISNTQVVWWREVFVDLDEVYKLMITHYFQNTHYFIDTRITSNTGVVGVG